MQFLASAAVYYVAAVALIASATPIARQGENPGDYGLYQLIQADGSCLIPNVTTLGTNGGYTAFENGTAVIAGECQPEAASTFLWLMHPQTPSSIEVYDGINSGFCLDAGSDPANGVAMKLWKCFDGLFQQTWWQTADNRTAIYNGNQCLDLALGSTTFVQTWQCTTGDIQQEWFANGPIHIN